MKFARRLGPGLVATLFACPFEQGGRPCQEAPGRGTASFAFAWSLLRYSSQRQPWGPHIDSGLAESRRPHAADSRGRASRGGARASSKVEQRTARRPALYEFSENTRSAGLGRAASMAGAAATPPPRDMGAAPADAAPSLAATARRTLLLDGEAQAGDPPSLSERGGCRGPRAAPRRPGLAVENKRQRPSDSSGPGELGCRQRTSEAVRRVFSSRPPNRSSG